MNAKQNLQLFGNLLLILLFAGWNSLQAQQTISINNANHFPSEKNRHLVTGIPDKTEQYRRFEANPLLVNFSQHNVNDTLLLDFFDKEKYKAVVKQVTRSHDGITGITAQIEDTQYGYCFISVSATDFLISAELPASNEYFSVKKINNDYYLYKQKLSEVQDGGTCEDPDCTIDEHVHSKQNSSKLRAITSQPESFAAVTVDVLVVYTPAAKALVGAGSIDNVIDLGIQRSNLVMNNSNTGVTFHLVYKQEINYVEANSPTDDLQWMKGNRNGAADEIHALRGRYNADLVVLLVGDGSSNTSGAGYTLNNDTYGGRPANGLSTVKVSTLQSGYTLVHEMGHNFGCGHHTDNNDGLGIYAYSHGWRNSSANFTTVMTYEHLTGQIIPRIPYFSDPTISHNGTPTGDATIANNAKTIRQTKGLIAEYDKEVAWTDSYLKDITLSAGTLSPAFNPAVKNYTVTVPNNVTTIDVTGIANSPYAAVTGSVQGKALTVGDNTIEIDVEDLWQNNPRKYTITVTRQNVSLPVDFTWKGSNSADGNRWDVATNWVEGMVPGTNAKVTIPNNAAKFPVLSAVTAIDEISFAPGAELGRQDYLTYNKARVALDFSSTGLARGQWHLLSMPLDKVVTGDFNFGGYPYTYLRKFEVNPAQGQTYQQAGWKPYSANNEPLAIGEGFALWVNAADGVTKGKKDTGSGVDALISTNSRNYGLGQVNGIIELPYFENQTAGDAHRIHKYENGKSIFYTMNTSANDLPLVDNPSEYARGAEAYKLAPAASMNIPVKFGEDNSRYFALVGNPFMSTIDFQEFCKANGDIKKNYQVWTGSGFSAYGYDGESGIIKDGVSLDRYIAPMQAFFVEKSTAYSGSGNLNFDLANISASDHPAILRSSPVADKSLNKLNITASNDRYKVLTYIARREYGSDKFSDADSRKIIPGMSDVPEIYTLKDSEEGRTAAGSNIIHSDMLVPVGLATAYEGNIRLTFSGMDQFDSRITFIDLATGTETDLTGKKIYEYDFNYVPKKSGDEVKAEENRFLVRIQKSTTGLADIEELAKVYTVGNTVYAVSSVSNPIRMMEVYNLQGKLLYSGKNIRSARHAITLNGVASEVCIVRLVTELGVKSVKLFMNK